MSQKPIEQFMYDIAVKMNQSNQVMDKFINILKENWFYTVADMGSLDQDQLKQLGFPLKLAQVIIQQLQTQLPETDPQPNIIPVQKQKDTQQQIQKVEDKIEDKQQGQKGIDKQEIDRIKQQYDHLQSLLDQATKNIISIEQKHSSMSILQKLLSNISNNPNEAKFRQLNIQNQKLQVSIFQFAKIIELIEFIGFEKEENSYVLKENKIDMRLLNSCVQLIQVQFEQIQNQQFNSTQSYAIQQQGIERIKDQNITNYVDLLQQLKRMRHEAIKPIQDRKFRLFIINHQNIPLNQLLNYIQKQNQQEQAVDDNKGDNKVLLEFIKQQQKRMNEDMKFSSKSKKEYNELLSKPLYFPNNELLQFEVSPYETVASIYELIRQNLVDKNMYFHIFTTPPRQVMDEKHMNKSMQDIQSVPTGMFHLCQLDRKLRQSFVSDQIRKTVL